MPIRHRSRSAKFKRQIVAKYLAGETLHTLSRRHDLSRDLIRIWVEKSEAVALDEGGVRFRPSRKGAPASVTAGPRASPSGGDTNWWASRVPASTLNPWASSRDEEIVAKIRVITDMFEAYGYSHAAHRRAQGHLGDGFRIGRTILLPLYQRLHIDR